MGRIREKISLYIAKKPQKAVLIAIMIFNIVFFTVSALVISALSVNMQGVENFTFWESVFYTVSMILDAGCIQYVVADVGKAGVVTILVCLAVVIIGMILFTGAVIGYITNYISSFVETANSGSRKLRVSGHIVILNWNNRAAEIINDLLYNGKKEKIIVLVPYGREEIEKEIESRISDTLEREKKQLLLDASELPWPQRGEYIKNNRIVNKLTVIVREGDIFATKDLNDICLDQAKTVIILGQDIQNVSSPEERREWLDNAGRGNQVTVKTLIQVAEITGAKTSADSQKIVVEVEDDWTLDLVTQIKEHKERQEKCNIVLVPVNRVLGQILSQFSIMPELNRAYSVLFSNKDASFCTRKADAGIGMDDENAFIKYYLSNHGMAVPLGLLKTGGEVEGFYMADCDEDIIKTREIPPVTDVAKLNRNYKIGKKNIVILGHNSKMAGIMAGFNSFRNEWNNPDEGEILNIMVVDTAYSIKKNGYYKDYPYVSKIVEADVYDRDTIYDSILEFSRTNCEDTSILILSDDLAPGEQVDASVLTYLIYVQHIIKTRMKEDPGFRPEQIDVIVEIINPKNSDVVRSYSVDNVVISNRYISRMITQIGEKEAIFDFYKDILSYDDRGCREYVSKELYIKKAGDFFEKIPGECTAEQLIRKVYFGGPRNNRSIILGYIRNEKEYVFFSGVQRNIDVKLQPGDKLILFSNH